MADIYVCCEHCEDPCPREDIGHDSPCSYGCDDD